LAELYTDFLIQNGKISLMMRRELGVRSFIFLQKEGR
jgi:hypothetical protein